VTKSKLRILNNRYALPGEFNVGGMADLYKAQDMEADRPVAVKMFREGAYDADFLAEALRRELMALSELRHPNIVELFDHGRDEETGRHFIVLEWIDHDLEGWLKMNQLKGWDHFYEQIGRTIIDALAFTYSRNFAHRDLKPKNILVAENQNVKLADFGIAKWKSFTTPGVTLAEFGSRPFTPPEYDDGSWTYTRDTFGFGVVVLRCLTDVPLQQYEDINRALDALDAPDEVYGVLERCVSLDDPSRRTANASLLQDELEKIWRARSPWWVPRRPCYLRLTKKLTETLSRELKASVESEIKSHVVNDLNSICGIKRYESRQKNNDKPSPVSWEGQYLLIGAELRYHVIVDKQHGESLVILNAWRSDSSVLEGLREDAWMSPYDFRFGTPANPLEAGEVINELRQKVIEHDEELRRHKVERLEDRLFQTWRKILDARTSIEKSRHQPLRYEGFTIDGKRIRFHLTTNPDEEIQDQPRLVRAKSGRILTGLVAAVSGNDVILHVEDGDISLIPRSGLLEYDSLRAEKSLDKQKASLDAVRFNQAIRSDLRTLISHPKNSRPPEEFAEPEFTQTLDDAKRDAVIAALGAKDFLVVEGPPGTGKTTFITETIVQTLRRNPDARILLTSQTHVALDNAVERLRTLEPGVRMVRLASRHSEEKVADSVYPSLLGPQLKSWKKEALEAGRKFLNDWASAQNISAREVDIGITIGELVAVRSIIEQEEEQMAALKRELDRITQQQQITQKEAADQIREDISSLNKSLGEKKKRRKGLEDKLAGLVDLGESLSKLSIPELHEWIGVYLTDSEEHKQFQDMQEIYADWGERFGRSPDFIAALLASRQVVAGTCVGIISIRGTVDLDHDLCILDEASKATPTEALIPLVRSRRWILVGDQRQLSPFQDPDLKSPSIREKYDLSDEDLGNTLFDHLIAHLPSQCRTSLTIQHRMIAPIGNMISRCFYDGRLKSADKQPDPYLESIFRQPVSWFTTAELGDRWESRSADSFVNHCEVRVTRQIVLRINKLAEWRNKHYSLAILVGYSGQKREMERALNPELKNLNRLEISIDTVDAYQGREADIALYSITRANRDRNIGFLRENERINVALSRGRYYLGIIGDHIFCRNVQGINPFKRVIEHIEEHPDECDINVEQSR